MNEKRVDGNKKISLVHKKKNCSKEKFGGIRVFVVLHNFQCLMY